MPAKIPRHKVFISFHEQDMKYRDRFIKMMGGSIVDKSVHDDDIDDLHLRVATIRQRIRDNFIADATVTVVLIGPCTWQRKHVDWEIGSSIRKTKKNSRCGLLGILLLNHHNFQSDLYNPRLGRVHTNSAEMLSSRHGDYRSSVRTHSAGPAGSARQRQTV